METAARAGRSGWSSAIPTAAHFPPISRRRRRRVRAGRDRIGSSFPQRLRLRRGQLADSPVSRSPSSPGLHKRLRGAHRQCRSVLRDPQSQPEIGSGDDPRRLAGPPLPDRPADSRHPGSADRFQASLRRDLGLRPQGRAPHLGLGPSRGCLRACQPRPRWATRPGCCSAS